MTADSVEFDQALDVYTARGNVKIERQGSTLTADWVAFNNTTRHGLASGNVVLVDEEDTLYADFLQFNVESLQGVVFQGTLQNANTNFRMEGEEVRKTEDQTYVFKEGLFTTCECPEEGRDPWALKADTAKLEVGGYATARNTTLEILGVPIIWLPWFIYPLKNERQSGLLFPEFRFGSRAGTEIGIPYFWAAHPQVNVVVTPTYAADVGPFLKFDLDYVIGEEGRIDGGDFFGIYAPSDDRVETNDPERPYSDERWGFDLDHLQDLPWFGGVRLAVAGGAISDNDVPFDFPDLGRWRRDRFLCSVGSLAKHFGEFGSFGAFTAVQWADDMQAPEDQDRDKWLLQRLPEVGVSQMTRPFPWAERLLTSFDVRYTHYWYRNDPRDELPDAVSVDDIFLDTGIDALPDGSERNSDSAIVTLDGRILNPDGTVITADEVLAAALEADPDADPAQLALDIADQFNPDQNADNFPPGFEGDGIFQEGEPLADKGHRLLLNPRLAAPFRLGDSLEVFPELGYHGTFYQTDLGGSADRNLITGRVDLRSRLHKQLTLPFGRGTAEHVMEPQLSYLAIADLSDSDGNPIFIPQPRVEQVRLRQLELDNYLRDPSDRIHHFHGVVLGMANRFYTLEVEPTEEELAAERAEDEEEGEEEELFIANRLYADVSTSLLYSFTDTEFGWFVADGVLYPTRRTNVRANFGYDLEETQIAEGFLRFGWSSETGHDLYAGYRYLRDIPAFFEDFQNGGERFDEFEPGFNSVNQVEVGGRWALAESWAVSWDFRYSLEDSLALTNRGAIEYISKCKCWAARLRVENDRSSGIEWGVDYVLLGLGDDTVRPFRGGFGVSLDGNRGL